MKVASSDATFFLKWGEMEGGRVLIEFMMNYWMEAAFGGVVVAIRWIYKRQKAVELGIQALLRAEIIHVYNRYIDRGYCPIYALENVQHMYEQYHALGGNGTITKLVEDLTELPTDLPDGKEGVPCTRN